MTFALTACGGGGSGDEDTSENDDPTLDDVTKGTFNATTVLNVSYVETYFTPAQIKTYTNDAVVTIEDPLTDDFERVEDNPFHLSVTANPTEWIGSVYMESASLYECDGDLDGFCDTTELGYTLLQPWYYSGANGSYSGSLQNESIAIADLIVENIIYSEYDSTVDLNTLCYVGMSYGTQVDVAFDTNEITISFKGDVIDSGYQSCAQYVDGFELSVTVQY